VSRLAEHVLLTVEIHAYRRQRAATKQELLGNREVLWKVECTEVASAGANQYRNAR
jgi:hypothetical protein